MEEFNIEPNSIKTDLYAMKIVYSSLLGEDVDKVNRLLIEFVANNDGNVITHDYGKSFYPVVIEVPYYVQIVVDNKDHILRFREIMTEFIKSRGGTIIQP